MKTRFRIGPFTFGSSGTRLSPWKGGTGFSMPISNRKSNKSFGKAKLGMFSFHFNEKTKKDGHKEPSPENIKEVRKSHKQAYEPWTAKADEKLLQLFRQGKTVKELSEIFGRTTGAIRSRINKLLLQ